MLDAISEGRLDVGFARAFLPHEFRRFGRSPDESMARFREGGAQVDLLLTQENVSHEGRFHTIRQTNSLPRPTQRPRPKFYVAALNTPASFSFAGEKGYSVMAVPLGGGKMRSLIGSCRKAWADAGHEGDGEVMLAFHLYCAEDGNKAHDFASPPLDRYLESLVDAAADWLDGQVSQDYPDYDQMITKLKQSNAAEQIQLGAAWIGSPSEIDDQIVRCIDEFGTFEHPSLQVNFNTMPLAEA